MWKEKYRVEQHPFTGVFCIEFRKKMFSALISAVLISILLTSCVQQQVADYNADVEKRKQLIAEITEQSLKYNTEIINFALYYKMTASLTEIVTEDSIGAIKQGVQNEEITEETLSSLWNIADDGYDLYLSKLYGEGFNRSEIEQKVKNKEEIAAQGTNGFYKYYLVYDNIFTSTDINYLTEVMQIMGNQVTMMLEVYWDGSGKIIGMQRRLVETSKLA